jgi:hypothetical protein
MKPNVVDLADEVIDLTGAEGAGVGPPTKRLRRGGPPPTAPPPRAAPAAEPCAICLEVPEPLFAHALVSCGHAYCQGCLREYLAGRVRDRAPPPLGCPRCKAALRPDEAQMFLDPEERAALGALEARAALGTGAAWCPNPRCAALLAADAPAEGAPPAEAERGACPYCKTEICVGCKQSWHEGLTCAQFASLPVGGGEGDREAAALALARAWKRCPGWCVSVVGASPIRVS